MLTVAVLREGLAAGDYAVRLAATEALGEVPDEVALRLLAGQLGDPEEDVRAAAVLALRGRAGSAARKLLEAVRDDKNEVLAVRVLAASALLSSVRGGACTGGR